MPGYANVLIWSFFMGVWVFLSHISVQPMSYATKRVHVTWVQHCPLRRLRTLTLSVGSRQPQVNSPWNDRCHLTLWIWSFRCIIAFSFSVVPEWLTRKWLAMCYILLQKFPSKDLVRRGNVAKCRNMMYVSGRWFTFPSLRHYNGVLVWSILNITHLMKQK